MIVVDTSVIVAVIESEPEAAHILSEMTKGACLISTATWIELHKVMLNRYPATGADKIKLFMKRLPAKSRPRLVALNAKQAKLAIVAMSLFGAGKHGLNYGDSMSYALAKARNIPLLYKGHDFSITDILKIEAKV